MRTILLLATAAIALSACNQNSVSLTNASPEEVAKAAKDSGLKMKPGQWETTVEILEVEMPGLPKAGAEQIKNRDHTKTHSYCLSAEEAENPGSGLFTGQDAAKSKCKVDKFTMNGGHIEQTISCPNPDGKPGMTMSTSGTYTSESMTGTANMEMGGFMKMKVNLSSKRVGECTPAAKK